MANLDLYNAVRKVPKAAQKRITGGRLSGMTDINPMWRIKCLTEQFGACGFGWYYEVAEKWTEEGAGGEITANIKIHLYVKIGEEWSRPIEGIGGSMLVAKEKNGLYVNDECYKMALTDAISVACKALGMGADVYWNRDDWSGTNTKYHDNKKKTTAAERGEMAKNDDLITEGGVDFLTNLCIDTNTDPAAVCKNYGVSSFREMRVSQFENASMLLEKKLKKIKSK